MEINSAKVEACIERICDRGSLIVDDTIRGLEQHKDLAELGLHQLSARERERVLLELRELMAIFEANRTARPPG